MTSSTVADVSQEGFAILSVLRCTSKRQILLVLSQGAVSPTTITLATGLTAQTVSQALRLAATTELVEAKQIGQRRIYRLTPRGRRAVEFLREFM